MGKDIKWIFWIHEIYNKVIDKPLYKPIIKLKKVYGHVIDRRGKMNLYFSLFIVQNFN